MSRGSGCWWPVLGAWAWAACPFEVRPWPAEASGAQETLQRPDEGAEADAAASDAPLAEVAAGELPPGDSDAAPGDAEVGPLPCTTAPECDDGDGCTEDYCDKGACTHLAIENCTCSHCHGLLEGCTMDGECAAGLRCHVNTCTVGCETAADCDEQTPGAKCLDTLNCYGQRPAWRCDPPGATWPGGCAQVGSVDDPAGCQKCNGAECTIDGDCKSNVCSVGRCSKNCATDADCASLDTLDCSACRGTGHRWACGGQKRCERYFAYGADADPAACLEKTCGPYVPNYPWTCQPDDLDTKGRLWCTNNKTSSDLKLVWVAAGTAWIGTGEVSSSVTSDGYLALFTFGYAIHKYEPSNAVLLDWLKKEHDADNVCSATGDACLVTSGSKSQLWRGAAGGQAWGYKGIGDWIGDSAATGLTWTGARDYCAYLNGVLEASGMLGTLDLCTEAQWEKAARGGCEYHEGCATPGYPWGSAPAEPTCQVANMSVGGQDCGLQALVTTLRPDGASPYGAYNMAGNVDEWVLESTWHSSYVGTPTDGSEWSGGGSPGYLYRGGSQGTADKDKLKASYRDHRATPKDVGDFSGFRCCWVPQESIRLAPYPAEDRRWPR